MSNVLWPYLEVDLFDNTDSQPFKLLGNYGCPNSQFFNQMKLVSTMEANDFITPMKNELCRRIIEI